MRRGAPERRPVVVMSMVRSSIVEEASMANAWRTSSLIGRDRPPLNVSSSICAGAPRWWECCWWPWAHSLRGRVAFACRMMPWPALECGCSGPRRRCCGLIAVPFKLGCAAPRIWARVRRPAGLTAPWSPEGTPLAHKGSRPELRLDGSSGPGRGRRAGSARLAPIRAPRGCGRSRRGCPRATGSPGTRSGPVRCRGRPIRPGC